METKLFELRDKATFIPVMAVVVNSRAPQERYLLRRAGYSCLGDRLVLLCELSGGRAHYDPYAWGGRTFPVAHEYINLHWHELTSGDVVDVEFILGESAAPKTSEAFE